MSKKFLERTMAVNRTELKNYISETLDVDGKHLFSKYPDFEVFRHRRSQKWVAVIMEIPKRKLGLSDEG